MGLLILHNHHHHPQHSDSGPPETEPHGDSPSAKLPSAAMAVDSWFSSHMGLNVHGGYPEI